MDVFTWNNVWPVVQVVDYVLMSLLVLMGVAAAGFSIVSFSLVRDSPEISLYLVIAALALFVAARFVLFMHTAHFG